MKLCMKLGFRKSLLTVLTPLSIVCATSTLQASPASDEALQQEVQRYQQSSSNRNEVPDVGTLSLVQVIDAINALKAATPRQPICVEKSIQQNSATFVTSYNAEGKPCKIYDLAFPTLLGVMRTRVSALPVQGFNTTEFAQLLQGEIPAFSASVDHFKSTFSDQDVLSSWYGGLRFKTNNYANESFRKSFLLSELDFGAPLRFSREERMGLEAVLAESGVDPITFKGYLDNPETMLSNFELSWNEKDKVFDLLASFDFLPIRGPIALVDYNIQYKFAVEKIIRSAILKSLKYLTSFIPEPNSRRVVQIALGDAFEFLELMYDYHHNRLEDTLSANLDKSIATTVAESDVERGINILFAQRSSLLQSYILSRIQNKDFDLNALDKVGREIRYTANKARSSLLAQLHSDLVLKRQCSTTIEHNYFAVCNRSNNNSQLYSLLSMQQVFTFKLGAPRLHNYQRPAEVAILRSLAWQMSIAARIIPLPIPEFITNELVKILKNFALAGGQDEAFLLNYLVENKYNNGITNDFANYHIPWLFGQNVNPFLVKHEESEVKLINLTKDDLMKKMQ